MKDYKIRLGYVPVMRDTFPAGPAEVMRDRIRERVEEIVFGLDDVELLPIDGMVDKGMIWDNADVPVLAEYFIREKADALFFHAPQQKIGVGGKAHQPGGKSGAAMPA